MSVTKRGHSFAVTIYDAALGRKRWVGTYATLKLAKQAEAEARLTRRRSDVSVGVYAARWLALHPRPKRSTNIYLDDQIRRYARSPGEILLADITRLEAREGGAE